MVQKGGVILCLKRTALKVQAEAVLSTERGSKIVCLMFCGIEVLNGLFFRNRHVKLKVVHQDGHRIPVYCQLFL